MTVRSRDGAPLGIALAALLLGACRDECDDLCDGLDDYRRFPCSAPPHRVCNNKGQPAAPLNPKEVAHVKAVKDRCQCK
jgi:hypothetical protein